MSEDLRIREPWKWRFSMALGVMYGPIPVGLTAVAILAILYVVTQ